MAPNLFGWRGAVDGSSDDRWQATVRPGRCAASPSPTAALRPAARLSSDQTIGLGRTVFHPPREARKGRFTRER